MANICALDALECCFTLFASHAHNRVCLQLFFVSPSRFVWWVWCVCEGGYLSLVLRTSDTHFFFFFFLKSTPVELQNLLFQSFFPFLPYYLFNYCICFCYYC